LASSHPCALQSIRQHDACQRTLYAATRLQCIHALVVSLAAQGVNPEENMALVSPLVHLTQASCSHTRHAFANCVLLSLSCEQQAMLLSLSCEQQAMLLSLSCEQQAMLLSLSNL
jgi:hypothetical protein